MLDRPGLARVRPEQERGEAPHLPEVVQHRQVRVDVVGVVAVRRVLLAVPLARHGHGRERRGVVLGLALVVDGVESDDVL